ncbi:hypothetical protein TRIUR3_22508 [Triticum urartu]|uniref:Uncharacterized protein n=1 Tax=Triticum urartu TaxID=4572 RepID=M7ZDV8_TRIUA|nr:hypothetical protein TRIUR3_22508 [Triticum urartu]
MVKILEIGGGPLDAEEDDDCCEIDPAEFAKKVNLKASADDDVVVVAAKGPIKVKVEVDGSEHSAETIPIIANGNGGLHGRIAGDRLDNPYEIEEDEPTIHQMEPLEAKPDVKSTPVEPLLVMSDSELPFGGLFADMSPVKREPEDGNGNAGAVDEPIEEEIIPDMSPLKCGSECFEEVVIPDLSPVTHNSGTDELSKEKTIPAMPLLKSESEYFEDVAVPVMSPIKHKPEDHHGAEECVGEEDGYDHLPEMDKLSPEGRVFNEEDGDDVVVVAKQAL